MNIQKLPFVLLCIYFGKILFQPVSWIDVGVLLVIGSCAAFYEAWSQLTRYELQENQIQALSDRVEKFEKMEQELRTHVASLKLGTQIRMGGNVR